MSDSVKKWHEMQEDKHLREKAEVKKKAYRLLTEYDEETIRTALKIIDDEPSLYEDLSLTKKVFEQL